MNPGKIGAMLCLLLLASPSASFAQTVKADYHKDIDLAKWKTFKFQDVPRPPKDPLYDKFEIEQGMRTELQEQLQKLGLRPADKDPDFLISYCVMAKTYKNVYGGSGVGITTTKDVWENLYSERTLFLDLADTRTKDLAWRGTATTNVMPSDPKDDYTKDIRKLVERFKKDVEAQRKGKR
ncbi:MAG TPA: DUF4136 domain-containing protein [Terriglobales bacterium]|nr:DUF4136 domain-containing protein [Terriglobales bacterium]